MTEDKENAYRLYYALDRMLDLFKNGKVLLPSGKGTKSSLRDIFDTIKVPLPGPVREYKANWSALSPVQQADRDILMLITEVEALRDSLRETYGKAWPPA